MATRTETKNCLTYVSTLHSNALANAMRPLGLDKVINLRQYILRYTVANWTSLRKVTFH